MDFVRDQLATGREIDALTIVETFSHFSPVVDPHFSHRAEDMVTTLEKVCVKAGYPWADLGPFSHAFSFVMPWWPF